MGLRHRLAAVWHNLRHDAKVERELDDELRATLGLLEDERVRAGMQPDQARRAAAIQFGGLESVKARVRDVRQGAFVAVLLQDLRYAARSLRRSPSFSAAAVMTLAIGIGASVAIFTVANATLLTAPPYPEPERLLVLTTPDGGAGTAREFTFVRERSRALAMISAERSTPGWNLVVGSHAEFVDGIEVTDRYFETYGVTLLLGQGISRAEARIGGARTVVLSESLWRRVFGARTDVLGKVIEIGGNAHVVTGITPVSFRSLPPVDVWTPMQIAADSNAANLRILGRIAPGRTHADVRAELDVMRAEFRAAVNSVGPARRVDFLTWLPYQEWVDTGVRGILMLVLLGAVGFLLLLSCINVAGLQVARGLARETDFATRAALGAGRVRLLRQAATESLLIAGIGAAVGLAIAVVATRALLSLLSADVLIDLLGDQPVRIDGRVILTTVLLGLGSALVSGLLPAVGASHVSLTRHLRQPAHQTPSRRSTWVRRAFVIGQVAIAVVLMVGAGLLIRTFVVLRGTDLGFNPTAVLVGEMATQGDGIGPIERNTFIAHALRDVKTLPSVAAASVSNRVPVDVSVNLSVQAKGETLITQPRAVDWTYVTDEYFALLNIPIRAGRFFDRRDGFGTQPVAIVNEAAARAFYGRVNVVGETVQTMGVGEPLRQIVGIVGDTKARSNAGWTRGLSALGAANPPILYVPAAQASDDAFRLIHSFTPMRWIVKARAGVGVTEGQVREALRRAAPRRPFIRFLTMDQIIGRDLELQRFLMTLLTVFSTIAFALAVIGVYALVSYTAAQRTREIGIRMALGATAARVLASVVREGIALGAAGLALGVLAAAFATRGIVVFLVGVTSLDPLTYFVVGSLLLMAAGLAAFGPAIRGSRVNPSEALRTQ